MKLTLAVLLLATLGGCSSFLYYPTRDAYYDPQKVVGVTPENVWIDVGDGVRLHGWYFKHKTNAQAPKARLIFFHGNGQNLTSHYVALSWLLDKGYDYLIFDYRGYGLSGGKPNPQNTVEDGLKYLHWLAERKPRRPLIVFGQSLGGAVAMRTVIEAGPEFPIEFVAVESTFASYRSMGKQALSSHWVTWPFSWLSYLVLSDRWAPAGRIEELAPRPMLVTHGDQDPIVPLSQGERLFASLKNADKEFCRVEGGAHTDAFFRKDRTCRNRFYDKLEAVVKKFDSGAPI